MSISQPPILALDVDGVLAPAFLLGDELELLKDAVLHWPRESYQILTSEFVAVAAPVVGFLKELHSSGEVEIRWHTTWNSRARTALAPLLGLPDWELLEPSMAAFRGNLSGWWKLQVIEETLQSGRSILWVDDDIADAVASGEVSPELLASPQLQVLSPKLTEGLTQSDFALIAAALKELSAAS